MYVKEYLKIDQCKHGYLYLILARQSWLGIFDSTATCFKEPAPGFLIRRIKFTDVFLWVEHHYDCKSFATAQPIKELELSPFDPSEEKLKELSFEQTEKVLQYLEESEKKYSKCIKELLDNLKTQWENKYDANN